MKKPAIWVSDQGRQNWPVQSQKQAISLKVWILEEQGLSFLCSKNNDANQLCSY